MVVEVVDNYLTTREERLRKIRDNLQSAEHKMVRMANKKRSGRIFEIGDLVYFKLQLYQQKNYSTHNFPKTGMKGPYLVLERIVLVLSCRLVLL